MISYNLIRKEGAYQMITYIKQKQNLDEFDFRCKSCLPVGLMVEWSKAHAYSAIRGSIAGSKLDLKVAGIE